jgi:hypothetical protein
MLPNPYIATLRLIAERIGDSPYDWVITGSVGMALQGMPVEVHDIDLQTDAAGAYEIERRLAEYVITPVRYVESPRIRSHLGSLEIRGLTVEVMGALQKRIDDAWEPPVDVGRHRRWVTVADLHLPVLSLAYEYQAYLALGRLKKAAAIQAWLETNAEQ